MFPHAVRLICAGTVTASALVGAAVQAAPGGWGSPGWASRSTRIAPSLEGQIDVARFRAEGFDQAAVAKSVIVVIPMPGDEAAADPRTAATYEAAVEGQLVRAGFQAGQGPESKHLAEVRIVRAEAEPAEEKRNPVSGQMSVGVSNHGSMVGMAISVDGSKPKKALLSTRLEVRIRDRSSGQALWEGRAQMYSRDGDERWTDDAIAARLARALFVGFPNRTGESRERR